MDKLPIYSATIGGFDETGIFAMSFVEQPANEKMFVALKKQKPLKLSIDKQKQILTGVVLTPEQLIYRNDAETGEYYLKFTAAEIEKISLKMMQKGAALTQTTHQHEKPLKGNYLAELWIVKDPKLDKSVALGLGELAAGTLVASYKIGNSKYWRDEVLSGNVKGFSLEGLFNFKNVNMKKNFKTGAQLAAEEAAKKKRGVPAFFKSLAKAFLDSEEAAEGLVEEAAKDETDSGKPFLIFDLAEGGEVYCDEDGFCTLDGEQMPAGEHALDDGCFIVINEDGELVLTQPEADGAEPAAADVAMAKQRAKAFLKAQKPAKNAELDALRKRIAELERQPSTPKAKPSVEGNEIPFTEMTRTQKLAMLMRGKNERKQS
jgi:hypothetical protein